MSIRDRHLAVRRAQPPPLRGAQAFWSAVSPMGAQASARRRSHRRRKSAAVVPCPRSAPAAST